jgi:hypothetical protein
MVKDFKEKLKKNGQTLKWFYDYFKVKDKVNIGYPGFCHQLNGYAPLSSDTKKVINEYMED